MATDTSLVRRFSDWDRADSVIVGGKNVSLGELINKPRESEINVLNSLFDELIAKAQNNNTHSAFVAKRRATVQNLPGF